MIKLMAGEPLRGRKSTQKTVVELFSQSSDIDPRHTSEEIMGHRQEWSFCVLCSISKSVGVALWCKLWLHWNFVKYGLSFSPHSSGSLRVVPLLYLQTYHGGRFGVALVLISLHSLVKRTIRQKLGVLSTLDFSLYPFYTVQLSFFTDSFTFFFLWLRNKKSQSTGWKMWGSAARQKLTDLLYIHWPHLKMVNTVVWQ